MGPIEVLYLIIGAIFVLIGIARGYVKELGATLIILIAIFVLTFFAEPISAIVTGGVEALFGEQSEDQMNLILCTFYTLVFAGIVYMGYVGRTLAFPGKPASPPGGFLLSLLLGLINGYLIAATLWYYQNAYGYPWFDPFIEEFSETAQRMIELLPPVVFENPVFWIVPVAVLLLIRVRG